MSIASQIEALSQDKEDIAAAIEGKGVTVPSGSGFRNFAGLIAGIQTGAEWQTTTIDFTSGAFFNNINEVYDNHLSQLLDTDIQYFLCTCLNNGTSNRSGVKFTFFIDTNQPNITYGNPAGISERYTNAGTTTINYIGYGITMNAGSSLEVKYIGIDI